MHKTPRLLNLIFVGSFNIQSIDQSISDLSRMQETSERAPRCNLR